MIHSPRVLLLSSAAALALALAQPILAAEGPVDAPSAPPATTPDAVIAPGPAPASAPVEETAAPPAPEASAADTVQTPETGTSVGPADSAQSRAEARRAERDVERNRQYQDLRQRAAEVGLELPETPPWEEARASMPEVPEMPPSYGGPSAPEREALRQRFQAMREKMQNMSPEERKAMREAHWKEMRERAAERGVETPETPPWEDAEKRFKEAQERFEQYRKTIDEMSAEQLEAARAIFGGDGDAEQTPPMRWMPPMRRQMPYGYGYGPQGGYPGYGNQGGYPGYGAYQGDATPMGQPPMPYYNGGMEQGPPPPQGGAPY